MKKGLDGFHHCINKALGYITVDHMRKFSAKSRRYMLAYIHLDEQNNNTSNIDVVDEPTYLEIEKLVQTCKTHRNTQDQCDDLTVVIA